MRKARVLFVLVVLFFILLLADKAFASWYAGNSRYNARGATGYISTPSDPLIMVASGLSNWVSTLHEDANGKDWMQTGWRYYDHYTGLPKRYWEYCYDYGGPGQDCLANNVGTQGWGTTNDYWVIWDGNQSWCAYSGFVQVQCVDNLHNAPATVVAKSEVHGSSHNPLDTIFDDVRYKATDNVWRHFNQDHFSSDFPYEVEIFTNYHYRNYRLDIIYMPLMVK